MAARDHLRLDPRVRLNRRASRRLGLAIAALVAAGAPGLAAAEGQGLIRTPAANALFFEPERPAAPEIDGTYFLTPNVAAMVANFGATQGLIYPRPGARSGAAAAPTLTLQYHFTDLGAVRPYVGGGVTLQNATAFDARLWAPNAFEGAGVAGAMQTGLDVTLRKNWTLSLDYRYLWTAESRGEPRAATSLRFNPSVWGVGLGYRF